LPLRPIADANPGATGIGIDIAGHGRGGSRQGRGGCVAGPHFRPVRLGVSDPATSRRCSPDGATGAITDVQVRGPLLILERTRSALTVLWHYLHEYLMHDLVRFYSSAEIAKQWGLGDAAVISRLQKKLWRRKLDTSRACCAAKEPGLVLAARPGEAMIDGAETA
jgi:hypothetical protein